MKREPIFETEAALCAAFIAWAKGRGYTCYPETEGWDILLVDAAGFQIGVEAKLKLNAKVISQALPQYSPDIGPDHRAVLVPELGDLRVVLPHLGIECFYCTSRHSSGTHHFAQDDGIGNGYGRVMFDWNPKRRHKLPEYMPDVPAGVPGPLQLTSWKISALRLLARLQLHGPMTRKEVTACGLDPRRWCSPDGWLVPHGSHVTPDHLHTVRNGLWQRGPACPAFDQQHPEVYAQVLAEEAKRGPVGRQLQVPPSAP